LSLEQTLSLLVFFLTIALASIKFSFQLGKMQNSIDNIKDRLDKIDNTELHDRLKYRPKKGE